MHKIFIVLISIIPPSQADGENVNKYYSLLFGYTWGLGYRKRGNIRKSKKGEQKGLPVEKINILLKFKILHKYINNK